MKTLGIDLETFCVESVKDVGAHRYAEKAEILLFGYAYDDDPVQCIDLAQGEKVPGNIIDDIISTDVRKTAYNAMFERTVLSKFLGMSDHEYLDPKSWWCTQVMAAYLGLPLGLGKVSQALWPNQVNKQKDAAGKRLIRYFSMPCKPTKANGGRERNYPCHDIENWNLYKSYNIQDVEVERNLRKICDKIGYPKYEHDNYVVDQLINDRGTNIDVDLVKSAIKADGIAQADLTEEMQQRTGLDNPNSLQQLSGWLERREFHLPNLQKATVEEAIKSEDTPDEIKDVLDLRLALSKTTVKKYHAAEARLGSDNRIRGLFQFYGANRTGRFAGRGVQVQNLSKNTFDADTLAPLRDSFKKDKVDFIRLIFGGVSDNLSQLIRTIFIPSSGNEFIISDYHAIEAVVSAWICGEEWVLNEFRHDGMLYESTAAQMFHVDKYDIKSLDGIKGPHYELRGKGKVATLACGYGGGTNAFLKFGADKLGMTDEEMQESVSLWRNANPHIVGFWKEFEKAAKSVIRTHKPRESYGLKIIYDCGLLRVQLPSGRYISYVRPHLIENRWGGDAIQYFGTNQETGKWGLVDTWGGKILENVVQATSRDILCNALANLEKAKIDVVMHVHDETINDVPKGLYTVEDINELMCTFPAWCGDIPLSSDGYKSEFYLKD